MKRRDEWIQYSEAEEQTGMESETLEKLVRDGTIRKKPWYRRPLSMDLLRRGDVRKHRKAPPRGV